MKRIVSALLSVVLVFSSPVFSIADETERYVTVSVEYSDNIGTTEQLELMVKNDQVYVNAEMLAARLGYLVASNENAVVIYNIDNDNLPNGFTWFFLDSKQVSQTVSSQIIDTYEAPFPSMKNEEGFWIPLEYSLLMLNSGMMILDDALEIDVPQKDIIDIFYDIQKNGSRFRFDWSKDFGYTDMDWKVIGTSSHLVNLFNGLLELDGGSWAELVQSFAMDSTSYDRRYGENLAMLLCTQSDGELQALREEMEFQQNIFFEEGKLGQFLSGYSKYLDDKVGMLYEESENILEEVRKGNSSVVTYNKTYQALEDAVDKQTWFSETGENILEVQRGMSEAIPILNVLLKVAEVVGYGQEFANQEEFSLSALQSFMETPDTSQASDSLPDAMKDSMIDYASMLSTDLVTYSAARYFQENVGGWIADNLDINKALGTQANAALIAWDIASDVIPFISNGLAAADKFELALYSQVFQADVFMDYQNRCSNVFQSVENINAENLYTLSQYCFLYLKSCYISRNAALGSLEGKRESVKEEIQPLIEEQNGINDEIAEMLIVLKDANETNSGNVYGFLPEDNEKYLADFDNSDLLVWVENSDVNKDQINLLMGKWQIDAEKTMLVNGVSMTYIFGTSYKLGNEMEMGEDFTFSYYVAAGNGGEGTWKISNGQIIYEIMTYDDHTLETGKLRMESQDLTDTYLIMNYDEYSLYWKKAEDGENDSIFEALTNEFIFARGSGAWQTQILIEKNGSFTGAYSDLDSGDVGDNYPDGTIYICNFTGKFSEPQKVDEYTYSMKLESIENEKMPGEIYYEDNIRYVCSEPHGFESSDEFLIYLPGTPLNNLPNEFMMCLQAFININMTDEMPCYGIYNVKGQAGFIECKKGSIHNEFTYLNVKDLCNIVEEHYNKTDNTNYYVVFESECEKNNNGYSLVLRWQGGNAANTLVTLIDVNLSTGEVTDKLGNRWNLSD